MLSSRLVKITEWITQNQNIRVLKLGYFGASTDTAAALRALEIEANVLLKATKVDGVYDADPEKNPSAKIFNNLTYNEYIERGLKVMDMTSITLAMGQKLPVIVFNLRKKGNILSVVTGHNVGTLISGETR